MRGAIASYLRSVEALYPGGIPRHLLQRGSGDSAAKQQISPAQKKVIFLELEANPASVSDPYSGGTGELLRAAIEKGMKLPLIATSVARSAKGEELLAFWERTPATVSVILGEKTATALGIGKSALGALEQIPGRAGTIIRTVSLEEALADGAAKRTFWAHLKVVMSALGV